MLRDPRPPPPYQAERLATVHHTHLSERKQEERPQAESGGKSSQWFGKRKADTLGPGKRKIDHAGPPVTYDITLDERTVPIECNLIIKGPGEYYWVRPWSRNPVKEKVELEYDFALHQDGPKGSLITRAQKRNGDDMLRLTGWSCELKRNKLTHTHKMESPDGLRIYSWRQDGFRDPSWKCTNVENEDVVAQYLVKRKEAPEGKVVVSQLYANDSEVLLAALLLLQEYLKDWNEKAL
ncbi:hypothetical protein T439DRAFT_330117, partial [Meredithblackwellia eburnea MCA 4105]